MQKYPNFFCKYFAFIEISSSSNHVVDNYGSTESNLFSLQSAEILSLRIIYIF